MKFYKLSVMTADKAAAAFSGLPEKVLPLFKPPVFLSQKSGTKELAFWFFLRVCAVALAFMPHK